MWNNIITSVSHSPGGIPASCCCSFFVLSHHPCLAFYLAFHPTIAHLLFVTYQSGFSFPTRHWPLHSSCLEQLRVQTWGPGQSLSLLLLIRAPCLNHSISARQPLMAHIRPCHHLSFDDINILYRAYAYEFLWVILEIWVLDKAIIS